MLYGFPESAFAARTQDLVKGAGCRAAVSSNRTYDGAHAGKFAEFWSEFSASRVICQADGQGDEQAICGGGLRALLLLKE